MTKFGQAEFAERQICVRTAGFWRVKYMQLL